MTTIAAKDGILASDSRVTNGDMVSPASSKKAFKLRDGRLIGLSGDVEEGAMLLQAVKKNEAVPCANVHAIMVDTDGSLHLYEGNIWIKQKVPFMAIGTGAPYALVAMSCGKSAVEAVKYGKQFDVFSGGRTQVVRLGKKRK